MNTEKEGEREEVVQTQKSLAENSLKFVHHDFYNAGMSVAIAKLSVSSLITVGPNTMATLVANILFTDPNSTTLHKIQA